MTQRRNREKRNAASSSLVFRHILRLHVGFQFVAQKIGDELFQRVNGKFVLQDKLSLLIVPNRGHRCLAIRVVLAELAQFAGKLRDAGDGKVELSLQFVDLRADSLQAKRDGTLGYFPC